MGSLPADDGFVLVGHGRRIAAALLDGVLGSLVVTAFGAVGFGIALLAAESSDAGWDALGWFIVALLVALPLGVVFWVALTVRLVRRPGARNGQTIGKQLVGIRAVRADRREIGTGCGLLREFVAKLLVVAVGTAMISALPGFSDGGVVAGALVAAAIWYAPAVADEQRRGLHDRLCDTRVVVAGGGSGAAAPNSDDDLWPAPA